eukprot:gnl/MRDRNA2_/MRDRNA2_78151_c0_seq1.p1 gnl/MRDRNA2_/MRDRNA2_78151_c0~~gnl/MRDRNA2_/MRDRNA2_78151_c0_seq1.p1  ORF type:complete len:345 (-),score=74.49 gnl/MRDRNA2_/MRDRNA2_78151_c0_seq1:107-1141(-)
MLQSSSGTKFIWVACSLSLLCGSVGAMEGTCAANGGAECVGESTKLRLSLEWFLNPDHLPLLVANKTGIFKDVGLEVEIIEPDDHFEPLKQIQEGKLDVAITETIHLIQDRAKGEKVMGFGRFLHTDGGVMFLKDSGITRPRDMCPSGKKTKVQYPGAPGPGGLAIIKTMVEADGGECNIADLEPVNNGFQHTDALKDGKADVATLIFYNFEVIEAQLLDLNPGFFSLKHWGVPDFCQLIFFTTPETYERIKPALRKLNLAVRKGVDMIKQDPKNAKAIWNDWTQSNSSDPMNDAILDATLPMFPNDQTLAWEYYEKMEKWLVATKQVEKATGARDYWTNEIAL